MAPDLHKDFERLDTSAEPPDELTVVEQEVGDRSSVEVGQGDNHDRETSGQNEDKKQPGGDAENVQYARHKPSVEAIEETPTPPIDVPNPLGDHGGRRRFNQAMQESYNYDEEASLATTNSSSKRTSLSFDPLVKLDSGDKIALEAPVPKLSFPSNSRGRSLFEEIHRRREEARDISRAFSDSNFRDYDPDTGEKFLDGGRDRARRDTRFIASQPRWPFLQTTVDELAANGGRSRDDVDRQSLSITSRYTSSPLTDEVRSPLSEVLDSTISPITIPSPARSEWSSPVPSPRRQATRSRSYGTERKPSRRNVRRTNSSMSPAGAFLSKYMATEQVPDPDAEGQEVGDYVMGREIGFGGFSIIREAYTFQGNERIQRAVKIVRRQVYGKGEMENESLQAEFEHEVNLWRYLHHKYILPLLAVYVSDFATFAFMQMNTGGTLFDAVRANRQGLPGHLARRYSYQLASAMRYLHEDMRIIHRDIKLENCLLDLSTNPEEGGNVLLCDFGLADYMTGPANPNASSSQPSSPDGTSGHSIDENPRPRTAPFGDGSLSPLEPHRRTAGNMRPGAGNDPRQPQSPQHTFGPADTSTNLAGSLPYAAPELLEAGRGIINPCVDIWAYGVTIYSLVTGRLPFQHSFAPRVRVMILSGEWDREKVRVKEFGPERVREGIVGIGRDSANGEDGFEGVYELVEGCLERDPKWRLGVRGLLESRWLEVESLKDGDDDGGWG